MTSIILINAVLGAIVLTAIVSLVAWAIKTQHRDLSATASIGATRRSPRAHAPVATRRELAHRLG
jgi:hypothetical protein